MQQNKQNVWWQCVISFPSEAIAQSQQQKHQKQVVAYVQV